MKTYLILAHPNIKESRANKTLCEKVQADTNIYIHNLYEKYPKWNINIEKEQELLLNHDRVVLQFPLYWYSTPPLLKKWQDDVLTYGWAFGGEKTKLINKQLIVSTTIGGHVDVYRAGARNQFTISEILRPLQATANICKMQYLPAFVTNSSENDKELDKSAKKFIDYIKDKTPRGILLRSC